MPTVKLNAHENNAVYIVDRLKQLPKSAVIMLNAFVGRVHDFKGKNENRQVTRDE